MSRLDLRIEHKVLKVLKEQSLPGEGRTWLLAVSGGVDSMAAAEILWRWRQKLKVNWVVAHVHHGEEHNSAHRLAARQAVRQWCKEHHVRFITNSQIRGLGLKSEAELRNFRYRALHQWARQLGCTQIVLAHHADDLLETRVLRLIRGVGQTGLQAMRVHRGVLLRPFLSVTRAELEAYARFCNLKWVEDPTNRLTKDAFRNWVRHEWLHQLEDRQKGATKSLARSLEVLAPRQQNTSEFPLSSYVGLRRKPIREMSDAQRRSTVVNYLRAVGLQAYGRTHVDEIVKRLSTERREFAFELLGFRFEVTPDLVWASRV